MSRKYDNSNPRDREWKSEVYQTTLTAAVACLKSAGGSARYKDICKYISDGFPGLCDEDIVDPSSPSCPAWKHAVASALQVLKKRNAVSLYDGYWHLMAEEDGMLPAERASQATTVVGKLHPGHGGAQDSEAHTPRSQSKTDRTGLTFNPYSGTSEYPKVTDESHPEAVTASPLGDRLLGRVLNMNPLSFERLIGSVLTTLGFVDLEVTGGSRDGGIDGIFAPKLVGLKLAFQAKRYGPGNIVRAPEIRNFRGAMVANQQSGGLFITTSTFTDEARMEAVAAGPSITLINGKRLVEVMIENRVGIKDIVMDAEIDESFFTFIQAPAVGK